MTKREAEGRRSLWARHGERALWAAAALMVVAAIQRLLDGLACLRLSPDCAIDVRRFHGRLHDWFAGRPVDELSTLPPASYPLLWPLLGWLPRDPAIALWALTGLAGLAWLSAIMLRDSGADRRGERMFVVLWPWAMYAARATFVSGQFIAHVLPALLVGILLLERRPADWRRDLLAAALVLFGLLKPSVAAPFVLVVMLRGTSQERWRPTALIGVGYAGLTVLAASFRDAGVVSLLRTWVGAATEQAGWQYGTQGAYGSVHHWLGAMGLERWNGPASLVALAVLGWWVARHREADIWVVLGVTAVVARLWTYHRVYDDMLLAPAMLALFRLAKGKPLGASPDVAAGLVLTVVWAGVIAPARLFFLPAPWDARFMDAESATWLAALLFLLYRELGGGLRPPSEPPPKGPIAPAKPALERRDGASFSDRLLSSRSISAQAPRARVGGRGARVNAASEAATRSIWAGDSSGNMGSESTSRLICSATGKAPRRYPRSR
jgi:hypothetical protein